MVASGARGLASPVIHAGLVPLRSSPMALFGLARECGKAGGQRVNMDQKFSRELPNETGVLY